MSLNRLVFYSAVAAGWAALWGWLIVEILFFRSGSASGILLVALVGGIVGATIGAALSLVAGLANGHWKQMLIRILPGMAGGALGGAVGSLLGDLLFQFLGLPRAIGWALLGMGIGVADGLYERSPSKIRNGLIGGVLGGLLGGFLFDPIQRAISTDSGMSSRAAAFVILGVCIGMLIGLAHVVLKHAWLTVLDGYRSGRQLILSQAVTGLGRADHLPLPFLGPSNQDLELEHAQVVRQADGAFMLHDKRSRLGTRLNGQLLQFPMRLKDGDVIKLGGNAIRFNQRQGRATQDDAPAAQQPNQRAVVPPPPRPAAKPPTAKPPTPASAPTRTTEARGSTPRAPASPTAAPPAADIRRGPPPPPPPRPKS